MKLQLQVEAAARLDGLQFQSIRESSHVAGRFEAVRPPANYLLPDYPSDHNAMQRLVDKMSDAVRARYIQHLNNIISGGWKLTAIVGAKCPPKLEATLKAYGVWEEEE